MAVRPVCADVPKLESVDKRLYLTASGLLITLGVITIAAISYAALALAFVRRRGLMILWPIWLLASVTATAALVVRTAYTRPYYTLASAFAGPFPVAFGLLLMCALGFGAVSLLVARRQQRGEVAFGVGLAARSVGACLLGVIVFGLAIAALDWATF